MDFGQIFLDSAEALINFVCGLLPLDPYVHYGYPPALLQGIGFLDCFIDVRAILGSLMFLVGFFVSRRILLWAVGLFVK